MKLKNIIKIGSFVVAGTLPTTSQGQVYMCQACPAGTYSDGTQTQCTPCPADTYSNGGAGSCTSCPSGQFANSSKTGCIDVRNATKLVSQVAKATIATCTTATLDPYQPYRVILRGGKGGNSRSGRMGANGGFVEYNFYVETKQTVELCAGNNGNRKAYNTDYNENPYDTPSNGAGGGAGSWIKFADNTFIAVGGGGGNGGDRCGALTGSIEKCREKNPTPGRNYITVKVVTNSDGKISGVSKSISIGGNGAATNQNNATAGTSTTPTNVGLSGKCSNTGWGCAEIWKVSSY